MGKESGIKIKYRNGNIPKKLAETLKEADETDLRILVSLLMLADGDGAVSLDALPETVGFSDADVKGSVKFWRGAGFIESAEASAKKTEKSVSDAESKEKEAVTVKTAHRNGVVETSSDMKEYSSSELAGIMERRVVSAQFVDEAQRVLGKIFRTYDTGILVGMVDRLGFEEEAVLVILNYIAGKGKKTLRYAETVAIALYDEGITETAAVVERIDRMEKASETVSKIKIMFGIGDRALTSTEKKMFAAWTEKLCFEAEVIKMAYDITVDNTQKPLPRYTNGILERWYSEGLRTADDVRKFIDKQSEGKSQAAKSYDADDFFEAALQRSYEDIK